MKIMTIFGTRPEAIKLAPVIMELKKHPEIMLSICVTAQHRQMLDQVLRVFEINPDTDLNLMQANQTLFNITAHGLHDLEDVFKKEQPDFVLVQGDTTTAFIASLAAFYLKIKVGHVEAGLRSGDKYNPFPEEINRRMIDVLSDICFAPTPMTKQNLLGEGIHPEKVFVTGNTVIDALLWMVEKQSTKSYKKKMEMLFKCKYGITFDERRIILVTGHRRESFGERFKDICYGLKHIAERNPNTQIIYPVHMNPNVREPVYRILERIKNIRLIEPLDYPSFIFLMKSSYLILTDSGGIQEEAPSLGKPVLVMRDKTERTEAVEAGVAKVVGTDSKGIFEETQRLLSDEEEYKKMQQAVNPFGDGKAAERIIDILYSSGLAD